MVSLQGTVEEIIFKNEANGYAVAVIETDDDIVTIVGCIPIINIGDTLEVQGQWDYHSKFGQQLKVQSYTKVVPSTLNGIEKYLSSGLIPGIGPKMAKKIVEKFGKESLDILQYNPKKLTEIRGIGSKKAEQIAEVFAEQRNLRDVIIFLQKYEISTGYAVKIYKKYGDEAVSVIKENPYRLTETIHGIGFKLADKIAINMGIDSNSIYRVSAGIKYTLINYSSSGHTYVPKQELIDKTFQLLGVDEELIDEALTSLALKQEIKLEMSVDDIKVYYMPFYTAEANVSKKLVELSRAKVEEIDTDIEKEISAMEEEDNFYFAQKQKEAIKQALKNGVMVLTGGPGTGKTTTINSIIKIFEKNKKTISLGAPTGRAAKRMTEASNREAKTIHRLLEYGYIDDEIAMSFAKNDEDPLKSDVIIIDEVSMVDILLMNNLLKAIVAGTRLILVGDVDQLPSVGPGNVLRDIINSDIVKVVKLDEIFRQARESMIVVNAHRINKGEKPYLNVKDKDFFFMSREANNQIVDTVIELCTKRLPKYNGYDALKDIQVLTSMKKGDVGVNALNSKLQAALNAYSKDKPEKKYGDIIFRAGDKVMQIKNNYKIKWKINNYGKVVEGEGIYNGDFGYITDIDEEKSVITILFDENKQVKYKFGQLDELKLAYATTIHKSQGSEFPVVVIPISWGPPMLLTRNLLYTAITRSKELVVLVGMKRYMDLMIENNRITKRYSGLKDRLKMFFDMFMNDNISE
ncbi:ATP-dependent RecD-like DNA helicase [Abyssisolibacter fermentans]|uniref:SF1B family DNA helicase RecD2 n=1 Tax=Abyssisolibacter fermentans TaxID=1766203 RepID=UPI00082E7CD1|nr:ATP-dependent RecD-like DNA helicase [Abyssisolibacter fermentans]